MNKVLLIIVFSSLIAVCICLPSRLLAMEELADQSLDQVQGQSGISLVVDDVQLYWHIQGLWYTDSDGLGTSSAPGASIGIPELKTMIQVNAITSATSSNVTDGSQLQSIGRPLQGDYSSAQYNFNNNIDRTAFMAKPLTIDVTDKLSVLSAAAAYNSGDVNARIAGVMIGLPTVEIVIAPLTFGIAINDTTPLDGSNTLTATNKDSSYGTISMGQWTLVILDGVLEIAPH